MCSRKQQADSSASYYSKMTSSCNCPAWYFINLLGEQLKRLVKVRNGVAAIFDFITEEDWGELKQQPLWVGVMSKRRRREMQFNMVFSTWRLCKENTRATTQRIENVCNAGYLANDHNLLVARI